MKTSNATAARMARYDSIARVALPYLRSARTGGIKKAKDFAGYLNFYCAPSPSGSGWTVDAVLRCFRRLKALGLDYGSLRPQEARTYGGPRKVRSRTTRLNMPCNLSAEEQVLWDEHIKKFDCP